MPFLNFLFNRNYFIPWIKSKNQSLSVFSCSIRHPDSNKSPEAVIEWLEVVFAYEELTNKCEPDDKHQKGDLFEVIKTWLILNFGGKNIRSFPATLVEYYTFLFNMTSSYCFRCYKFFEEKSQEEIVNDFEKWMLLHLTDGGIKNFPRTLEEFSFFLKKINYSKVANRIYELIKKYINFFRTKLISIAEKSFHYIKKLVSEKFVFLIEWKSFERIKISK